MIKKAIEDAMSREELAEEASDWKELMDPITDKMYFLNSITFEKVDGIPRAVAAKKELVRIQPLLFSSLFSFIITAIVRTPFIIFVLL